MNESDRTTTHAGSVEILAEWEDAAVHEPGVLFAARNDEQPPTDADAADLAAWIAVTALTGVAGDAADEAIKKNVLDVLAGCRHRFGQAKIDEVKQQLCFQVQQHRKNGKLTDEELRGRIEALFGAIRADLS